MTPTPTDWQAAFEVWLAPFLARLGRVEQRRWAPIYLQGLLGPGERKSVEPMAARVAPGDTQQLHHFVSASPWATAPLEDELVKAADRLVGGPDAVLVVERATWLDGAPITLARQHYAPAYGLTLAL